MRLTTLIFALAFMLVSAGVRAQKITINEKNVKLESVLQEIRKQSGYDIYYDSKDIPSDLKTSVHVTNASVNEALSTALKGLPLTFDIDGKIISIKKKPASVPDKSKSEMQAADVIITGTVKDDKGQAMSGVTINEKGTANAVVSGGTGDFRIAVSHQQAVLVFSFVGYDRQEIRVRSKPLMDVVLSPSNVQLNDVVVSGYTVQNRSDFTGSSSHIDGKAIENRQAASFDQTLAGQAAGVKITSNGGSLNATPVIRIRGTNSINLSSYPLIVIDGITSFSGNVGYSAAVENNPLSSINADDIESIEVLKDASATAIYGSRAANGVIVITTKKGRLGKARVSYDGYLGITRTPKLPKRLGAADYVMIKDEAQVNSGLTPTFFLGKNADSSIQQTDWYDYLYQTGYSQTHNLSISGASEATHYFVSVNFSDQNGFLVKNTFVRKSARMNLDHLLIKGLHIGTNFSYGHIENNNLTVGVNNSFGRNNLTRLSMVLPPNVLAFNPDGSYNISGNSLGLGPNKSLTGYFNPLPIIEHDLYSSASKNFLGLVYAEWELFKGFKVKTNYSINSLDVSNSSFGNPYQGNSFSSNGSAGVDYANNYRTDLTHTINYTTTIARNHHISALAGYEEIHTVIKGSSTTRTGVTDPYFQSYAGGFTTISDASGSYTENGFRSFFSNLFYDFKRRYLLSVSFRRDGFSGLAAGHKYGNFGGGSVGWNLSEESFYKNSSLANTVSAIKLRASYGQVGNVNIGDYAASSLYSSGTYGGVAALGLSQTGNPELKWETSKKTDAGISMGFWQNRITLDADYYNNNIDGLILAAPQSPSKGIPGNSINTNIGSMYNRGFEIDIKAHIIDGGALRWTAGFNFSTLRNRVTALANGTDIWTASLETSNITRAGYSVGSVYVVRTNGVNPANGLRTYVNRKKETVQYDPVSRAWSHLDGSTASAMDAY